MLYSPSEPEIAKKAYYLQDSIAQAKMSTQIKEYATTTFYIPKIFPLGVDM